LDAVVRSLAFIMFNAPGYPAYIDFPDGSSPQPEFFIAGGIDYFFADLHLTPGIKLGMQRPAFYRGRPDQSQTGSAVALATATVVLRDPALPPDLLPAGLEVEPVLAATASLKWDISEIMSAALEVLLRYDTNRTTFLQDSNGIPTFALLPPVSLGFNLLLQSRF